MATALKPQLAYPRPPVAFQADVLFLEPVYPDGPYDRGDEDDDLEDDN
ncbi:hypothetical protein [Streptomyces sp. NPDC007074]